MSSERVIINKIGIYDALIVWGILFLFLILQMFIGSAIILQILPALFSLAFLTSLIFYWRGRANAQRILNNKDSGLRMIFEGGIIGALFFPSLMLVFTRKIFFSTSSFWEDSEIFAQVVKVIFMIILFGIITGCFAGFIMKKFNERYVIKLK